MKNLFKIYLVLGLTFLTFKANAQVDKAIYDEAVDYINCRIAELSFRDQPKQPHLADFQATTQKCDMSEFKGSFHTTLKAFLTQRSLGKNQQLATYIQTLKTKYKADYQSDDLFNYLMDTLITAPTFKTFESKHQISYPRMEEELTKDIYELFGLASRNANFDDENNAIEGQVNTFTDSTNTYLQQDGGAANKELYSEEGEQKPTFNQRNKDNVLANQDRSFFEKYRWAIFAILILGAIGYWWFSKGRSFSKISTPSIGNSSPRSKANATEVDELNSQLDELRTTGISLQEEVDVLRFRVKEFETRLLNKKTGDLIDAIEPEIVESESVLIEEIGTNLIGQNVISDDDTSENLISMVKGEAFFMPIPSPSGIFDLREATSTFKRPYSVYLFNVTSEDGNQAEFCVHDDIATMLRALDNFDEYLRPACRSTAILHKNATKIITEENGLAIREGNEWKVVTKAVVRYG